jgi:hypothetical protein
MGVVGVSLEVFFVIGLVICLIFAGLAVLINIPVSSIIGGCLITMGACLLIGLIVGFKAELR